MAQAKKVDVYSTPTCPFCKQVKNYLNDKGIDFTDHDVITDINARNYMMQKSGQNGVPVIVVDDAVVVGFNRNKLESLLN